MPVRYTCRTPRQPAQPARRAGRFRLRAHWSRTRRMVGGVLGQLVSLLAGSLNAGPLVDAWDRCRVMLFTQFMLAAGTAGLMANALLGHPQVWLLFACTAEAAAFRGLDWSARRAQPHLRRDPGRPAAR